MSYGGFGGGSSETVMVESKDIGKIIGRGGQNIKELEARTHTKVKVSREEDGNGMKSVEITGNDQEISDAKILIEEYLTQGQDSGARGGGGGYGGRRDDGWGRRDNYGDRDGGYRQGGYRQGGGGGGGGEQETIYIESGSVGKFIGKGGSNIQDLEHKSGCRIKVSKGGDDSGLSSVELIGSSRDISVCKRQIEDNGVEIISGGGGGNDRGRW